MAYTPLVWQDGVTPVNATNLNHIETGLDNADAVADAAAALAATAQTSSVPLDGAVTAATRITANKLLSGHAQPAFRMMGDGKQEWGPGGATAPDTNLYRYATDTLATDDSFMAQGSPSQGVVFYSYAINLSQYPFYHKVQGEAQPRFSVGGSGGMAWGAGAVAPDTNLYRSAATVLKTDGHFVAGAQVGSMDGAVGQIRLSTDTGAATGKPTIYFGSALDTTLYRSAAGQLTVGGTLHLDGGIVSGPNLDLRGVADVYVSSQGTGKITLRSLTGGGALVMRPDGSLAFGYGEDTNLYRYGAGSLKTDGELWVGKFVLAGVEAAPSASNAFQASALGDTGARWSVTNSGYMQFGPGNAVPDTNLYRSAAGNLKTDGHLRVAGDISARVDTSGLAVAIGDVFGKAGIWLGPDAFYSSPVGIIRTDAGLRVGAAGVTFSDASVMTTAAAIQKQFPLKLLAPRSQTLAGNAFWTVTSLTAYDLAHWEFVKDVDGKVTGQIMIPKKIAATPNAKLVLVIGANATSGVTRLSVLSKYVTTDGVTMNPSSLTAETSQDITVPGTAYMSKRVTFPLTNAGTPAADQLLICEIFHEGAHANDTLAVNTLLYEAYLEVD